MSDYLSSCSAFCCQPTEWDGEDGQLLENASLEVFVERFPHGLDVATCSALFREAIQKSVKYDCADCFVGLCKKYYSLTNDSSWEWEDLEFAYSRAATERPNFISTICRKIRRKKTSSDFDWAELGFVIDVLVQAKNWTVLSIFFRAIIEELGDSYSRLMQQVERCVVQFMSEDSSWPHIASVLDLWVRDRHGRVFRELVQRVQNRLEKESWSVSVVSGAKQWCVDNGHANLAFVLALVTKDWNLVETAVSSMPSVDVEVLLGAVEMVAKPEEHGGSYSAGAAILGACPITKELLTLQLFLRLRDDWNLSSACEKRGLWDHALLIQHEHATYVLNHHRLCRNQSLLDWIFVWTVRLGIDGKELELALALLKGCTDSETLGEVLHTALRIRQMDIVKALLNQVDPSAYLVDTNNISLLSSALKNYGNGEQKKELVQLLLAAGLSPFQRDVDTTYNDRYLCHLWSDLPGTCPLKRAFLQDLPDIIHLTLDCGAYSYITLQACANDAKIQTCTENSEELKKCFECIQEAARTPTRLELLVRLAVSRSVGCQPGRADRIDKLPLPQLLKEMVKFNDILYPNTEQVPID